MGVSLVMDVMTRRVSKELRYLPKSEVESYCRSCGMTEREISATVDYLYNLVKVNELCERLGISRSTFFRHEKVLAIRLLRWMVSNGKIEEIQNGEHKVDSLVIF